MRRESPAQRRKRVARVRAAMTLNAWDRSALEWALHAYRREHGGGRLSVGMASVALKHFYGTGPKARARGGVAALVPAPNPFWAKLVEARDVVYPAPFVVPLPVA